MTRVLIAAMLLLAAAAPAFACPFSQASADGQTTTASQPPPADQGATPPG